LREETLEKAVRPFTLSKYVCKRREIREVDSVLNDVDKMRRDFDDRRAIYSFGLGKYLDRKRLCPFRLGMAVIPSARGAKNLSRIPTTSVGLQFISEDAILGFKYLSWNKLIQEPVAMLTAR
jgi:hypothetical protein